MTIRNDATRLRIVTKERRRLRSVVARQGQVLLDTDFDKQSQHHLQRVEQETADSLGSPGRLVVPAGNGGFLVTADGAPANFNIGAGRGYLDGWHLENSTTCKLGTQPHPRSGDAVNLPTIVAIKALIRHIDPVEDPVLADVALGDAQASGRALVDWQVFPLAVAAPLSCANALSRPEWTALTAASTGTLAAIVQTAAPSNDPCSLTPGGGYTRLENLLYRFEVHGGTAKAGAPTIDGAHLNLAGLQVKFSRRNASVLVRVTGISNADITVAPPALDPRNWFAPGAFAEIVSIHDDVDPRAALANERLFSVASATDDHVVLKATAAQVAATGANAADGTWFLRLWDAFPDGKGVATVTVPGNAAESLPIDLGDGLQIKLGGGTAAFFRRGDHWTCAARADGSIDWPVKANVAELMTPHGPETRYAPIAALHDAQLEDCRIPFATLTDRTLYYRGGDGQSVFTPAKATMVDLPGRLRVAVMRGETPVVGATVRWSLLAGAPACQINGAACDAGNSPEVSTDANGLAEVKWSIDATQKLAVHKVQAAIVTGQATSAPPLVFTATFDTAQHTGYTPGQCVHLKGVDNVQDALDTLCLKLDDKYPTIGLTSIALIDASKTVTQLIADDQILNGRDVLPDAFVGGIAFGFDRGQPTIDISNFPYHPIAEIELDLPYPITDADRIYWTQAAANTVNSKRVTIEGPFGFQRVRLDGSIRLMEKGPDKAPPDGGLYWQPSERAVRFLQSYPQHGWGQTMNPDSTAKLKELGWLANPYMTRTLCRIRLRSALIFVEDKTLGRIYLNAEHLGINGKTTFRELELKERDPQRAADLDMFIYLAMPIKP